MKERKLNNKGFSLVELIIVIAIMVILVVVFAPRYLRFVNNSRVSTDVQTAAAVHSAVEADLASGSGVFDGGNFDGATPADVTRFTTAVPSATSFPTSRFNGFHFVIQGTNTDGVTRIEITNGTDHYECYPNPDNATDGINGTNGLRQ